MPAPASAPGATSLNMVLRAQMNLAALGASGGSGNWGYTSPGGRRLALVGTSVGLSVVDVTNPASPRLTGTITGGSSAWREVKTSAPSVLRTALAAWIFGSSNLTVIC